MELRHLRYFVAIGEEQHYGRPAERLRVAQPALSRQIQDLEEEFGFKLFDRLPRGVKINRRRKITCGVGVAIVSGASQWRHPPGVSLLRVTDLNLQLPIALIWRVLTYRSGVTLVGAESSPAPRHSGLHKLETSIDNRTL